MLLLYRLLLLVVVCLERVYERGFKAGYNKGYDKGEAVGLAAGKPKPAAARALPSEQKSDESRS